MQDISTFKESGKNELVVFEIIFSNEHDIIQYVQMIKDRACNLAPILFLNLWIQTILKNNKYIPSFSASSYLDNIAKSSI